MKTLTFYDFQFRAYHAVKGRSAAAAAPHWHSYVVRLWFNNSPDQDELSEKIERNHCDLHACHLEEKMKAESTDENLAHLFLTQWVGRGCVRVRVTNDGRRGAEVYV